MLRRICVIAKYLESAGADQEKCEFREIGVLRESSNILNTISIIL